MEGWALDSRLGFPPAPKIEDKYYHQKSFVGNLTILLLET
jgi:hypothetical protein